MIRRPVPTQHQLRRPTFAEIQAKWRMFRSASTLLPLELDSRVVPAIEATRFNEQCIEIISDTLQTELEGVGLRAFVFCGLLSFVIAAIVDSGPWSTGIWMLVLGLPGFGLLCFFLGRVLGPHFRYRCSRVRFDRRSRRVYYVPYPEESSEPIWELEWDGLQGIERAPGRAQLYLYLVGFTCNLPEPRLVKIPVICSDKIFGDHRWAWLQGFMAKSADLPAPKITSFPRTWRDVLMRYGGRWIVWSFTTNKGRLLLPPMIWVDLAILLCFMPVLALPQLIILLYSELQFPQENDQLCGFASDPP
ncbi:conserved membrane hypothetical protein [Burkholderia cepacia]|nr:conserved membrane hypothetical protein [Burkholderia cepacia]